MDPDRRTSAAANDDASARNGGGDDDDYVHVVIAPERRSSPFASPTTLRTVQEGVEVRVVSPGAAEQQRIPQAQREESLASPRRRGTPTSNRRRQSHRITYEDLASRPRSNPRNRTPMRYESPLDEGAFRRDGYNNNNDAAEEDAAFEPRAISIRPTAGLGVGVVRAAQERPHFDDTNQRPKPITLKSQKQGPSKRKTRRWNNDNFVNPCKELANSSSAKSRVAAEILAQAKADARHFLPVYDPADTKRSDKVEKFMKGEQQYGDVRDKFFRGELHASVPPPRNGGTTKSKVSSKATAEELFQCIDGRLRRVLVKACENSAPACKVV